MVNVSSYGITEFAGLCWFLRVKTDALHEVQREYYRTPQNELTIKDYLYLHLYILNIVDGG
jgi:hypothetical protein